MRNYFGTFYTSPLNSADVSRIKSSSPSFLQGLMLSRYQLLSYINLFISLCRVLCHDNSWYVMMLPDCWPSNWASFQGWWSQWSHSWHIMADCKLLQRPVAPCHWNGLCSSFSGPTFAGTEFVAPGSSGLWQALQKMQAFPNNARCSKRLLKSTKFTKVLLM